MSKLNVALDLILLNPSPTSLQMELRTGAAVRSGGESVGRPSSTKAEET